MRYYMMHNNIGFTKNNKNTTYYITYNTINLILPDNDQMKTSGYFSDLRITFAFKHDLNLIWKDFLVLKKFGRNGIHLYLAQGPRGNATMPCYPVPTCTDYNAVISSRQQVYLQQVFLNHSKMLWKSFINEKDFESEWKPQLCIWKPSQRAACSSVAF